MSPVETCTKFKSCDNIFLLFSFPLPGAPSITIYIIITTPNFTLTNFEKLSHCDLNFSYNTVQDLFNYTISDNTSDYICSDIEEISDADTASTYMGYKYFSIDSNFNCKKIKPQTINCSPKYIYNESISTWYSWELINNDIIEDMSDVILNF